MTGWSSLTHNRQTDGSKEQVSQPPALPTILAAGPRAGSQQRPGDAACTPKAELPAGF